MRNGPVKALTNHSAELTRLSGKTSLPNAWSKGGPDKIFVCCFPDLGMWSRIQEKKGEDYIQCLQRIPPQRQAVTSAQQPDGSLKWTVLGQGNKPNWPVSLIQFIILCETENDITHNCMSLWIISLPRWHKYWSKGAVRGPLDHQHHPNFSFVFKLFQLPQSW